MARSADIVIVGGGIIGLSIAWHLAGTGITVTVLERGQVGGQATGAAAGMLAPLAEAHAPGPFVDLGLASLRSYPAFVQTVRDTCGLDPELTGPGMLRIALTAADEERLCAEYRWQRAAGLPVEYLKAQEVRAVEPSVSPQARMGILSPEEKHVEPRRLVRALALAGAQRGVRIVEGAPVLGVQTTGARVTGVRTASDDFPCGGVVVAGGAWTGEMGCWFGLTLPVAPVRGQILALACLPPPLRHTLYAPAGYLVPKADGRVVVGATEDRAGFDARPTAGGMARLLALAPSLVPCLVDAPFDSAWAGLRPASADGLPILGLLPGWENAHIAGGHFRNGILLAPITGEIIAHGITQNTPHPRLAPFRPDRFTASKPEGNLP